MKIPSTENEIWVSTLSTGVNPVLKMDRFPFLIHFIGIPTKITCSVTPLENKLK